MVTLEVTSAFVVDGRVELPGRVVQVPRADAAGLVARGKAVVAPAGTGGDAIAADEWRARLCGVAHRWAMRTGWRGLVAVEWRHRVTRHGDPP